MLKITTCCALVCACLGFSAAHAAAGAKAQLEHFAEHVHTLQADFKQVRTDAQGKVLKSQSGRVWLSRPGRFRWSYEQPYKQLIVCDGKKIWVYDPDLKQVTVRPAKQVLQGSPAALLTRRGALKGAFTLHDGGHWNGLQVVRLIPKSKQSDFKSIAMSMRDGVPVRMVFYDQLGDATQVVFSHVRTNVSIPAGRYSFKPPKGVDVVESN